MKNAKPHMLKIPLAGKREDIYMPEILMGARLIMGILTAVYFLMMPLPMLFINTGTLIIMLFFYFAFVIGWWIKFKLFGMSKTGVRLGNLVDFLAATLALSCDPFAIPPSIILLVITVLGDGMQHGVRAFFEIFVGSIIVCLVILPLRQMVTGHSFSYQFSYLILFLLVLLYYAYLLTQKLESLKQDAEQTSRHDPLTGLFNRRAFETAARYLLSLHGRTQLQLVFMFADLDDFKAVNDTQGHEMGDRVLEKFAELVKEKMRKTDIAGRFGGDEFIFMLADTNTDHAIEVANRLKKDFTHWSKSFGLSVDVSIGIGALPKTRISLEDIMAHVDSALYEAKKNKGVSGVVVAPAL